jgi:hypothetical protein
MISIGIDPKTHEKFDSFDMEKNGRLYRYQIVEILEWMYLSTPEDGADVMKEVENSDWDQETLVS